ncbi:MAG: BlaI/MecI/CopY family transcriptional regulator [Polyangiales bacterium]
MTFRLRPGKTGIRARLHDLEAEIMHVVWSRRLTSFAVGDVHRVLEKRREIAYTTVMTTVARLHEKDVLSRRKDGRRYVYSPRLTREEFLQDTAREVLDGLEEAGAQHALALLAEKVSEAGSDTLDELEQMIRRRRKEIGQ